MSYVRVCLFLLFLSCLFSVLYESLESVWFVFSKFLTFQPSCERNCLILFSRVFLNILFPLNKFYLRNFVRICCFKITNWNSETKLDLRISPLCVFFTPFFRDNIFYLLQNLGLHFLLCLPQYIIWMCFWAWHFRLVLFVYSNIYSPFSSHGWQYFCTMDRLIRGNLIFTNLFLIILIIIISIMQF